MQRSRSRSWPVRTPSTASRTCRRCRTRRRSASPADLKGMRVAWSADLGGRRSIRRCARSASRRRGPSTSLAAASRWPILRCQTDLEDIVVRTLGGAATAEILAPYLPAMRDQLGPEALASVDYGEQATARQAYQARQYQAELYEGMRVFFEQYDLLLTPTVATPPWTIDQSYPPEIDGQPFGPRGHAIFTPFGNHAGLPGISVPAGGRPTTCRSASRSSGRSRPMRW